jgi:glutamyl-tRNA(Gln) amidotransferase subunit E
LDVDYRELGTKVGIEIHRQLDTQYKLFCNCPTHLTREEAETIFLRRLRPTASELWEVDTAALFEFQKGLTILYEADPKTCCLVEMDEEPPHDLNPEAVDIALQAAFLLKAKPVEEIHVMRKIVIDGSNTCGFQRTCVVALGGEVEVEGRRIPLQAISLEEDAARKMEARGDRVVYRLDRLGIPLIEVATAPAMTTPREAESAALAIGRALRGTGKVKRGLGSIRQDLNISIRRGALIEVKGVQELGLISKVVENEVRRQLGLLKIKEELESRGLKAEELVFAPVDVTSLFQASKSTVIRRALASGGRVLALALPKLAGLLGWELGPNLRFGTELADRAKFFGGVGGLFHTDELPGYGITPQEVEALKAQLGLSPLDAAVLVADRAERAEKALEAVVERVKEALQGVPEETRTARPDGSTRYMRPRPGSARLYPETDIPPILITPERLERLKAVLPPSPEQLAARLMERFSINRKLAEQLVDSDYLSLFEKVAAEGRISPSFVATALTETMKSLERKAVPVDSLSDEQLYGAFTLIGEGKAAKEIFLELVEEMAAAGVSPEQALERLGVRMLSMEELAAVVDKQVKEHPELLAEKPEKALGRLMKMVMSQVRGKADPKTVAGLLREKLEDRHSSSRNT